MLDTLRQDFRRNPDPLARLVLVIFRFGQWTAGRRTLPRRLCVLPYKILNLVVIRLGTNSDLPRELRCGPGLRLFHPYGLVLHRGARLGADVDLYHHVTIGRRDFTGEPVIGDEVTFGAGAAVLGPVVIGPRAKIAARATVLDDVPAGGIALGPRAEVRPPAPGTVAGGRPTADPPAGASGSGSEPDPTPTRTVGRPALPRPGRRIRWLAGRRS